MEYRGLIPTFFELMVRSHAKSFVIGAQIGATVMADETPGTIEDKLNRAMEAYFVGGGQERPLGSAESSRVIGQAEPVKRGPGRPRKDQTGAGHAERNGVISHDQD